MSIGIPYVPATLRPAENFLKEMLTNRNESCYTYFYDRTQD